MKKQAGFTLIELVMVIVILGILAAVALPKFVDLSTDAKQASLSAMAGAISSGGTINFATRSIHPASGVPVPTGATGCTLVGAVSGVIDAGTNTTLSTGYTLGGAAPSGCTINLSPAVTGVNAVTFSMPTIP